MDYSSPQLRTGAVSFRCTTELKTQMASCAQLLHLSNSDLIRQALALFMKQHAEAGYATTLPAAHGETTVALISRAEELVKRDAARHHHISFLNRAEHDFQGFRFTISRQKHTLRRYFSPNGYGSETAALAAAIRVRDYVLEELARCPTAQQDIFAQAMQMEPPTQNSKSPLLHQHSPSRELQESTAIRD